MRTTGDATRSRRVGGGFTLPELLTVLLLLSLGVTFLVPTARRLVDRMAVLAAREAVVGMLVRVRAQAVAAGGAELELDPARNRVEVLEAPGAGGSIDLAREFGVELGPAGAAASRLRFDPLGLGRTANRTLEFRRGRVADTLTISAYGRVRR